MGRGSSISIRDRMIVWDNVCRGIDSPGPIKRAFEDADERLISKDSIRRLIKEFEDFKRLLSEYPNLERQLKKLVIDERDEVEQLRQHQNDLCNTAQSLLDRLLQIYRYTPSSDMTLADILVGSDNPDDIDVLNAFGHPQAEYLLSHLQSEELPRLQDILSWIDLKVEDINDELLNTLSIRMSQRDFKGKCDVCKDWP